ncbi:acyl carrier protein [Nocardia goodfellowii]|uniref:Act minimal PKS acyl carrier protein n=1 Tax=Nocardia goodfellowii TaxID=882446 RepID=A0ABS4QMR8_9NOCA|nr:acyl carrier protein [Nocardia goodfellowii]MBP2193006.1 act minimal PKS acyl carrier protein [Nocardia goodfellowii]
MGLSELIAILRRCAGVDDQVVLDDTIIDTDFDALGYDSIALLEVTSDLERTYSIKLGDDAIAATSTPREVLSLVADHRGER